MAYYVLMNPIQTYSSTATTMLQGKEVWNYGVRSLNLKIPFNAFEHLIRLIWVL